MILNLHTSTQQEWTSSVLNDCDVMPAGAEGDKKIFR